VSVVDGHPVKIYLPLFRSATNIFHISTSPISSDVIDLIKYVRAANPLAMSSCSISDKWEGGLELDESVSVLPSIHNWRSFSWKESYFKSNEVSFKYDDNYFKALISRCDKIEELRCPLIHSAVDSFKTSVLPNLKCLYTLMVSVGPFVDSKPQNKNVIEQRGWPSLQNIKIEEDERKEFAEELFRISWEAWERRDEGEKGNKLRYVGLGYRVYTYMFPCPGDAGDAGDVPRIVALSLDEARTFDVVEKGYWYIADSNPF
jgi:hypothetical protein